MAKVRNMKKSTLLVILMALLSYGCAGPNATGRLGSIQYLAMGEYYLESGKYKSGLQYFTEAVSVNTADPRANYYLGRCYLAERQYASGLRHLKTAAEEAPDNADFHFWLGVAYAATKQPTRERASYLRALSLDKKHTQALCYLGHNQFDNGELTTALATYTRALKLSPSNAQVLYNRALILGKLGRTPEEIIAWKIYLAHHPAGGFARRAVGRLNELGDFEYRNYLIGKRTVTLEKIFFQPFTAVLSEYSFPSLDLIGHILTNNRTIGLHIIAYQKNNDGLAEARAKSIKKYLINEFPEIAQSRLMVSWFDVPAQIRVGKKRLTEDDAISFITAQ